MSDVKEIAWSFFDKLNRKQIDEAVAVLDEDGTYWIGMLGDLPMPVMQKFFHDCMDRVPMTFDLHDALVDGDRVALTVESRGDTPNGHYNNHYCFIATVHGDKIVNMKEYVDTAHANEVLVPCIQDLVAPLVEVNGGEK